MKIPLLGKLTCVALHPSKQMMACGDSAGGVYLLELVGIERRSIIVTAKKDAHGLVIRCPACQHVFQIEKDSLGSEISCPQKDCCTLLKINSFVIQELNLTQRENENTVSSHKVGIDTLREQAKQAFEAGRYAEAVNYYHQALEQQPGEINLVIFHNAALLKLNRFQEALTTTDHILSGNLAEGLNFGLICTQKANALYGLGQFEQASAWYGKALEHVKDRGPIWHMQGCNFFKLKKYDQALNSLQQANALEDKKETRLFIGFCLYRLKRFIEADKVFENLVADGTEDATIYFMLSNIKKELDQRFEARTYLDKFYQFATEEHRNLMPQAQALMGELQKKKWLSKILKK